MKLKITYLLFLIIGISLTSCKKVEKVISITYRYVNHSGHELQLSVYGGKNLVRSEILQESSSFEIFKTGEGGTTAPIDGDSAYVIFFNPDKYLIYLATEDNGTAQGIFKYNEFASTQISDDGETSVSLHTFTFTAEDYNNAAPL